MSRWSFVFVLLLAPLPVGAQTLTEGACERLGSLTLPGTTITTAAVVASGTFTPAGATPSAAAALSGLPPFCRVAATLTPSADSVIKVEFWLPISTWNGKFLAVGNGSWGGAVSYAGLAVGVKRGYATASTDTGHVGNTAAEMLDHPEKLIDFAYRAVHETAATGKAVTRSLFGSSPRFSYFQGCSTGGRQGLQSAQLFPEDFDEIGRAHV